MKENQDNIDRLLQNVLGDCEMNTDGIDWNSFNEKKKKKRVFFYWKWAAIIIAIFGLCTYGYYSLVPDFKSVNTNMVDINISDKLPDKSIQITENKNINTITDNSPSLKTKEPAQVITTKPDFNPDRIHSKAQRNSVSNPFYPAISQLNTPLDNSAIAPENVIQTDHDLLQLSPIHLFKWKYEETKPLDPKISSVKALFSKTIFEISASAFAYSNSLKVLSVGQAFIHKDYEAIRRAAEHPLGAFDLRLGFGRKFNKLEVFVGLGYSQRITQGQYDFIYSEKPLIDADGRIIGYDNNTPKHIQYSSRQKLTFVEVPVQFRYLIKNLPNRSLIKFNLGVIPQFLKGINGEMPNAQFLDLKEHLSTENFKSGIIGAEFGLIYSIPFNPRTYLNIQPYYTINSGFKQIQSYYVDQYRYFGIRAGLMMRL